MLTQMVYPNFIINSSPRHHRCLRISLMLFICGATEGGEDLGVGKEGGWGRYPGAFSQDGWVWLVSVWLLFLKLHVGFLSASRKGVCLTRKPQMEFTRPAEAYIQGHSAWHSVLSYSSWLLRPGQEKVGTTQQKSITISAENTSQSGSCMADGHQEGSKEK